MRLTDVPKRHEVVDGFRTVAREVASDMESIFGAGVRPRPSESRHRRIFPSRAKRFGFMACLMLAGAAALTVASGLDADGGTTRKPSLETRAAVEAGAFETIDEPAGAMSVVAPEVATAGEVVFASKPASAPASVAQAASAPEPALTDIRRDLLRLQNDAAVLPHMRRSDVSPQMKAASPGRETRMDRMLPEPAQVRIVPQPKPVPPIGEKIVSRLATAHRRPDCVNGEPACMAARLALADQQLAAAQNRALAAGVRPSVLRSYGSEWRRARSESIHMPVDALQLYEIIISDFAILTEDAEARRVLRSR